MAKKRTVAPFYGKHHQRLADRARRTNNLLEAIRIQTYIRLDLKHRRASA